jgi:hypothetical protein
LATTRLDILKERLNAYIESEKSILLSQEYRIADRLQRRALLSDVRAQIKYLENEIAREESFLAGKGRNAVIGVIPRDV